MVLETVSSTDIIFISYKKLCNCRAVTGNNIMFQMVINIFVIFKTGKRNKTVRRLAWYTPCKSTRPGRSSMFSNFDIIWAGCSEGNGYKRPGWRKGVCYIERETVRIKWIKFGLTNYGPRVNFGQNASSKTAFRIRCSDIIFWVMRNASFIGSIRHASTKNRVTGNGAVSKYSKSH
jgi:hypothetical protein